MEFYSKSDDGKQKKRQSVDFKEITNIQTDMQISDYKWDKIFHNWDDPSNCKLRKNINGCSICKELLKDENNNE